MSKHGSVMARYGNEAVDGLEEAHERDESIAVLVDVLPMKAVELLIVEVMVEVFLILWRILRFPN